jgi:filamentous hemagglutinin
LIVNVALVGANKAGGAGSSLAAPADEFALSVLELNTQIGVRNSKAGTISGAHNADAFLESAEITGAKINNKVKDSRFPGLVEYEYQLPKLDAAGQPAGGYKTGTTKTVYDSKANATGSTIGIVG